MWCYPGQLLSSATTSAPILIGSKGGAILYGHIDQDPARPITSLGLICTVSSGASLTYSVQVTADPPTAPLVNWNNHDILVNLTASANSNILYPITAVRLIVTAYASGSVNLGMAQWA